LTDRCPHCSDYEDIKEELEETKRKAEKEAKDSLEKCERERKKMKKQLLVVGVVGIVAGTLLGKEFVDKVASYIESLNSVKRASTELISKANVPDLDLQNKKSDIQKLKNEIVDSMGGYPDNLEFSLDHNYEKPLTTINLSYIDSVDTMDFFMREQYLLFEPYELGLNEYDIWDSYLMYTEPDSLLNPDPFFYNQELWGNYEIYNRSTSPVPGPGALMTLAWGILFIKRRNRY
tara:strand:- start:2225 stop:2923 length:699 start_codon:yes stop_codon:yes gene_type:complete